jgi:hypothetical protein
MSLYDKIIKIYPALTLDNFSLFNGTILLQNDSDDKGDYIAKWEHPSFAQPTQQQIDAVE